MGGRGWIPWGRLAVALVLAGACAPRPAPEPAPAPEPEPLEAPTLVRPDAPHVRWSVRPLPVSPAFEAAVEAGTRTPDGRPGPAYWQQRVRYRIDAELDPSAAALHGQQVVTLYNRAPDRLPALLFHLHQNLFRPGEPRTERVPVTTGIEVERVVLDGRELPRLEPDAEPRPGAAWLEQGTLMLVRLPRPLEPGDSVDLEMSWRFTVPPEDAPRMGHRDGVFAIAQWYPQLATYDDLDGWHAWPYLGAGEFYLEYGDFDVAITVPEGWLVAATGVLENADEVLAEAPARRLAAVLRTDSVIHVVREEERGPGTATARVPGSQLTWRFRAEDVRDFAFGTSDRYVWDAARADGGERPVVVHAFYRPEVATWRDAADHTRHSLEFHARTWHPYIYPQMTSAEAPVFGMEYPMLTFVEAIEDPVLLYQVINHEVAHQWWPMMVGSKEPAYPWQDEGLTQYAEHLATRDRFPEERPFDDDLGRYLSVAGSGHEVPVMREADLFGPMEFQRVVAHYSKPALLLRALHGVIGEEAVHEALREYTRRWLLAHPMPLDFFRTVESVAGRDLYWFWHPFFFETAVLDQAIAGVELEPWGDGERATITVEDEGDAPMPVPIRLTLADGSTRDVSVPVDVWLAGERTHAVVVELPAALERVEIDPDRLFPDVDRGRHVWERARAGGS